MGHTKISTDIEQNIRQFQQLFADSADIKMKEMRLGKGKRRRCFLAYIEVAVSNMLLETTALGRLLAALSELPDRDLNQVLNENAMGISDVTPYDTIEDAAQGMLTGDAILFVDGYGHALKIADKGYPGMGVQEPDSEKVIRGSKEGFTDSIKTNTALIRKRVRSTRVRVEEVQEGVRSHTAIDLVYMADLKYTSVLEKIREKITEYEIDGVMDSGTLEQLAEKKWYSPFPQFQTTQRPDRAALAVMEGRIVLLCDNSPVALILPTDLNSFLKTSDDYYNRFGVATFARILRYMAAFFAMTLPGLYPPSRSTAQTRMSLLSWVGISWMATPSSPCCSVRANLMSRTRPSAKVSILLAPGKRSRCEISFAAAISGLMMAEMAICFLIKSSSWL